MPSTKFLTPVRRDILLALLAVAAFAAPVAATVFHIGEPTYRYERAEVTITESNIEYANERVVPDNVAISTDIACSGHRVVRPCALERLLLENRTVTTQVEAKDDSIWFPPENRYRYVLIDGAVYEPTYVGNETDHRHDGYHRVDLALERTSPELALRNVSISASALDASYPSSDVPAPVIEAARHGETHTNREIDVPETPIRLDDGSYYRVYLDERIEPPRRMRVADVLLTYISPLWLGLWVILSLTKRIEITYVGDGGR